MKLNKSRNGRKYPIGMVRASYVKEPETPPSTHAGELGKNQIRMTQQYSTYLIYIGKSENQSRDGIPAKC